MFTGMVEDIGVVTNIDKDMYSWSISIENSTLFNKATIGASIAINGVCLTQVGCDRGVATFDVVQETLNKTSLHSLKLRDLVNIERAMLIGSRIEGHLVQGHVDAQAKIKKINKDTNEYFLEVPPSIRRYIVEKGSVALDGISLTVASLFEGGFSVALIPHTLEKTNLKRKKEGDYLNIEIDLFAKYTFNYLGEHVAIKGEPVC